MTPEEAQSRAAKAQQLLEDEMLKSAFDATHDALVSALNVAKSPDEAFKATIALQTFNLVKGCIESHIQTAKVIEFNSRRTFVDKILGR